VLYHWAPNVNRPSFRWITPGSVLAVAVWLVGSAGFALYVTHFGSYDKTYGSLGGAVIFLVWLWISNLAVLVGTELNSELAMMNAHSGGRDKEEPRRGPDLVGG
jgi:membrane protein